jgi:AcrR family transcriptional regulator
LNKQEDILEAAQRLFGQHGIRKVTTDDIAREARASKATIYKLYPNKHEILKTVVDREMTQLMENIEAAVAAQTTVADKLRAHLMTKIGTVHHLINLHSVTSETMAQHWEHAPILRNRFQAEEARVIGEILEFGIENENLAVVDVKVTAHLLAASLKSLESPWDVKDLNLTIDEQADHMLNLLLNGLRKRD